jgi:hypothetical protein
VGKISKIIVAILISLFLIAFFLGIYITVDEEIPDNAVVVVTLEDKRYHSIHFDYICVAAKTAKTMVVSEAKEKGFKQDPHCQDLNYLRLGYGIIADGIMMAIGCGKGQIISPYLPQCAR